MKFMRIVVKLIISEPSKPGVCYTVVNADDNADDNTDDNTDDNAVVIDPWVFSLSHQPDARIWPGI